MSARYNAAMPARQPLPSLWLFSDPRNDAVLGEAMQKMRRGSGFVFRHYHLSTDARRARFDELLAIASNLDHTVLIAAEGWQEVSQWGADGVYAEPSGLSGERPANAIWIAPAHNGDEIQTAVAAGADALFLSPVFPTRSHPGAPTLGVHGFHVLAQQAPVPVIALGGMTKEHALMLDWPRWAAIDGLS